MGVSVNSISEDPFPKFKDIQLKIAVNETVTPIIQPYRRIPIPLENKINSKIDELVAKDIIEPVDKPASWVSPIVPILKSNGEIRICVDMRCANKAIIRENHPLPTMAQLIPKFRKATLFSKLDIREAFHQVEISEDSRNITTFVTGKGLFRYKRLMFGISCAPEHFQKILERMLLPCEGVINFIDDIIVFGSDELEHNTRLQNVLKVLKQNNVLLNEEKCIYKTDKIEFIGHELTPGGIKPLDKYIKGIEDFREPKTIEEVQSFLGLINFIGKWIPNLATLTEPLRELLRLKLHKNSDITKYWKQEQNKSFLELKKSLGSIKTLGTFRDKIPYLLDIEHIQTDLEVRDKDMEMKEKGKIEGDRKRNAQEDYLDVGEKVYVKNMIKENKLTSNFNATPHTVTSANGSDINIRNDITGHEYKRNIVHLKRVEGEWRVLNKEGEEKSQDISSNTDTGSN
ncbi:unnamed protein product [Euphydryas editha]|uniref:Reverse transcriptase domain-containing protein n=1 Tax=Euphydryas editha TaxID=104508 RepID=A0AAU9V8D7_EUPED|nr:unnamed protein product [Euphydryas editha]